MNGDLVAILKSLPSAHRRYLVKTHAALILAKPTPKPKPKNEDEKLAILAPRLGADVVGQYRFAYLNRASRFVSLYQVEQPPRTRPALRSSDAIFEALGQRYGELSTPQEPVLEPGGPAQFNRAYKLPDDSFEIDLVSTPKDERIVAAGYGYQRLRPIDHHPIVVLNVTPPLIEVSGRVETARAEHLKYVCGLTGLNAGHVIPVSFDKTKDWHDLRDRLDATIGGHSGNGRDKTQPETYAMHVRAGESLDAIPMWKAWKVSHDRARELCFTCTVPHPIDNYPEKVTFYLNLLTWQIKFKPQTSEHALATVTNAYIEIAKRP